MKISIIGSDSFLAGYIIRELIKTSAELKLFGISEEIFPELSFTKFSFPSLPIKIDLLLESNAVIYCAGAGIQSNLIEDKELIYELNAFQPIKIFNQLIKNNFIGKFISFGSYFEIGDSQNEQSFNEKDLLSSRLAVPNDYCISKRIFSRFLDSVNSKIQFFHFILPNIYGKNENKSRIIPAVIQSIRSGIPMAFTTGTQVRQYLHVQDIANQVCNCVFENFNPGIYNLTNSERITVKDLILKIYKEMEAYELIPVLNFGREERSDNKMPFLLLDDSKAKANLSWNPKINIKRGIKSYLL